MRKSRSRVPTSICAKCVTEAHVDSMGLCRTCRLRMHTRKVYHWTPAMDDQIAQAYKAAATRKHLTGSITRLATAYGFPRISVTRRAAELGLQFVKSREWGTIELEFLKENAGSIGIKKLARKLHRSESSVLNKIFRMGISSKLNEGYTQKGLASMIGVSTFQVSAWIRRGLLDLSSDIADRVTHDSVRRFIVYHIEEYSLRRVEEWWMKMLVKEELDLPRRNTQAPPHSNKVLSCNF
jgi:hypothetical protein